MAEPHPSHPPEWMFHVYLDGELAPAEQRALLAHLQACPHCTQALSELETLFQAIAQIPEVPLERELTAAVLSHLEPPSRNRADGLRWLLGLELAMAVLLLGILGPTLSAYGERLLSGLGPVLPYLSRWQGLVAAPAAWLELIRTAVAASTEGSLPLLEAAILLAALWVLGNVYLLGHSSVETR